MKFLVTGFKPFGGNEENASWEAVRRLPGVLAELAAGTGADGAGTDPAVAAASAPALVTVQIPVEFGTSGDVVMRFIERERPDVVLLVGEAGGRAAVTPEFVAINHRNARIPDNAGAQPLNQRIAADGPDAYFATTPVYRMVQAALDAGVEASVSYSAGTYCCNDVFYSVAHRAAALDNSPAVDFIHVPLTPVEVAAQGNKRPSMASETAARGIAAMIADLNARGLAGAPGAADASAAGQGTVC